jgi:hypothetical protein
MTRVVRSIAATFALVAIVLAATGTLTSSPSDAQSTGATHRLALVRQTPFVGPTGEFRVEVTTGDLPASTRLSLVIHDSISTRSRLDRTIDGEQLGTALFSTQARTVGDTGARGSTSTLTLPIAPQWPAPDGGTVLTAAGVYPVVLQATDPNGTTIDSVVTHLIRLPATGDPTSPLAVGSVVTIEATPSITLDGSPILSDADSTRTRALFRIVNDPLTTPPVSLAASPFTVQSLSASGADSLRSPTGDRQTLLQPYVPIDSGSLLGANLASTVDREYAVGAEVATSAFDVQPDHRTAVIDASTTATALNRAAIIGTRSVVLHSGQIRSSLTNGETNVLTRSFVITSENGTAFAAMASDDTTSDRFVAAPDPILAAHQALAELAMLHFEQPSAARGVALALPASIAPSALSEFLAGLSGRSGNASGSVGTPIIDPVTLDDLFTGTDAATTQGEPTVRDWTSDDPTPLGPFATRLEQTNWNLTGLNSMLPDSPDVVTSVEHTTLTAAARSLEPLVSVSILANADRQIDAIASGITLPESQTVTLTSRSGKIPLVIDNALPEPAHVRVHVSSPKLEFPQGSVLDIVLAPSGTTRTDIEVTTRASGAFPLDVEITSADGALELTSSRIDVRSTAISGWGLVLSIGAVLFLLLWWIRHFRTTRRARSLVRIDEPSPPTSA